MTYSVNLCHKYPEPHNENKPYLYSTYHELVISKAVR